MKPLDPHSRRLIDDVTAGDQPPPELEARLWRELAPRLRQPLPPTAASASRALGAKAGSIAGASSALKLLIGVVAVGTGVGALAYERSRHAEVAESFDASPAEVVQPGGRSRERAGAAPAVGVAGTPRTRLDEALPLDVQAALANAQAPAPGIEATSSLAAETQLLARAQRALRGAKPADALLWIDRHAARFPHGALAQERDAARVFALCAADRVTEARRVQRQFLTTWPDSPLAERVARACPRPPH